MEVTPVNQFDFYLRFAKPLVLNLSEPNERVLAAAWLQKLRNPESGDEQLRTDYLKLLLFVLQRKRLAGPFTQNPGQYEKLEQFPEQYKLQDVAKAVIEAEEEDRKKKVAEGISGASGDYPPYTTEYSADLLEYTAAQDIPNFGVHVYYAISTDPLPLWDNAHKGVFPRTLSSGKLDLVKSSSASISTLSATKSRSKSRSRSRSKSRTSTPKRKSPRGKTPPAPPLGVPPPPDERLPPTWGTNLIQVTEPPNEKGILDDSFPHYEEPPSGELSGDLRFKGPSPQPFSPPFDSATYQPKPLPPITSEILNYDDVQFQTGIPDQVQEGEVELLARRITEMLESEKRKAYLTPTERVTADDAMLPPAPMKISKTKKAKGKPAKSQLFPPKPAPKYKAPLPKQKVSKTTMKRTTTQGGTTTVEETVTTVAQPDVERISPLAEVSPDYDVDAIITTGPIENLDEIDIGKLAFELQVEDLNDEEIEEYKTTADFDLHNQQIQQQLDEHYRRLNRLEGRVDSVSPTFGEYQYQDVLYETDAPNLLETSVTEELQDIPRFVSPERLQLVDNVAEGMRQIQFTQGPPVQLEQEDIDLMQTWMQKFEKEEKSPVASTSVSPMQKTSPRPPMTPSKGAIKKVITKKTSKTKSGIKTVVESTTSISAVPEGTTSTPRSRIPPPGLRIPTPYVGASQSARPKSPSRLPVSTKTARPSGSKLPRPEQIIKKTTMTTTKFVEPPPSNVTNLSAASLPYLTPPIPGPVYEQTELTEAPSLPYRTPPLPDYGELSAASLPYLTPPLRHQVYHETSNEEIEEFRRLEAEMLAGQPELKQTDEELAEFLAMEANVIGGLSESQRKRERAEARQRLEQLMQTRAMNREMPSKSSLQAVFDQVESLYQEQRMPVTQPRAQQVGETNEELAEFLAMEADIIGGLSEAQRKQERAEAKQRLEQLMRTREMDREMPSSLQAVFDQVETLYQEQRMPATQPRAQQVGETNEELAEFLAMEANIIGGLSEAQRKQERAEAKQRLEQLMQTRGMDREMPSKSSLQAVFDQVESLYQEQRMPATQPRPQQVGEINEELAEFLAMEADIIGGLSQSQKEQERAEARQRLEQLMQTRGMDRDVQSKSSLQAVFDQVESLYQEHRMPATEKKKTTTKKVIKSKDGVTTVTETKTTEQPKASSKIAVPKRGIPVPRQARTKATLGIPVSKRSLAKKAKLDRTAAQDIIQEANQQMNKLEQLYRKYQYPGRRPDVERTPPPFSEYREIRQAGEGIVYPAEQFGLTEQEFFQSGPEYFKDKKQFSPYVDNRRPIVEEFPGLSTFPDPSDWLLAEEPPRQDIIETVITPTKPSPKEEMEAIMKDVEVSPVWAGLPVTTPKRSPSPRRTVIESVSPALYSSPAGKRPSSASPKVKPYVSPPRATFKPPTPLPPTPPPPPPQQQVPKLKHLAAQQFSTTKKIPSVADSGLVKVVEEIVATAEENATPTIAAAKSTPSPTVDYGIVQEDFDEFFPDQYKSPSPQSRSVSPPLKTEKELEDEENLEEIEENLTSSPPSPQLQYDNEGNVINLEQEEINIYKSPTSPQDQLQLEQIEEVIEIETVEETDVNAAADKLAQLRLKVMEQTLKKPSPVLTEQTEEVVELNELDQPIYVTTEQTEFIEEVESNIYIESPEGIETYSAVSPSRLNAAQTIDELAEELVPVGYYYESPRQLQLPQVSKSPVMTAESFREEVASAQRPKIRKKRATKKIPRVSPVREDLEIEPESPTAPRIQTTPKRSVTPTRRRALKRRLIDFYQPPTETENLPPSEYQPVHPSQFIYPENLMGEALPILDEPFWRVPSLIHDWEDDPYENQLPEPLQPQIMTDRATLTSWQSPETNVRRVVLPKPQVQFSPASPQYAKVDQYTSLKATEAPPEMYSSYEPHEDRVPLSAESPAVLVEEEIVEETYEELPGLTVDEDIDVPAILASPTQRTSPPKQELDENLRKMKEIQMKSQQQYDSLWTPSPKTPPRAQDDLVEYEEEIVTDFPDDLMPTGTPPSPFSTAEAMQEMLNTLKTKKYAEPSGRRPIALYGYGERKKKEIERKSKPPALTPIPDDRIEPPDDYIYWPGPYQQVHFTPLRKVLSPNPLHPGHSRSPLYANLPPESAKRKNVTSVSPTIGELMFKPPSNKKTQISPPVLGGGITETPVSRYTTRDRRRRQVTSETSTSPAPEMQPQQTSKEEEKRDDALKAIMDTVEQQLAILYTPPPPPIKTPEGPRGQRMKQVRKKLFVDMPKSRTEVQTLTQSSTSVETARVEENVEVPEKREDALKTIVDTVEQQLAMLYTPPRPSAKTPEGSRGQRMEEVKKKLFVDMPELRTQVQTSAVETANIEENVEVPELFNIELSEAEISPPFHHAPPRVSPDIGTDERYVNIQDEAFYEPSAPVFYQPSPSQELPSPFLSYTPTQSPPGVDPRLKQQLRMHDYTLGLQRDQRPYQRSFVRVGSRSRYDMGRRLPQQQLDRIVEEERELWPAFETDDVRIPTSVRPASPRPQQFRPQISPLHGLPRLPTKVPSPKVQTPPPPSVGIAQQWPSPPQQQHLSPTLQIPSTVQEAIEQFPPYMYTQQMDDNIVSEEEEFIVVEEPGVANIMTDSPVLAAEPQMYYGGLMADAVPSPFLSYTPPLMRQSPPPLQQAYTEGIPETIQSKSPIWEQQQPQVVIPEQKFATPPQTAHTEELLNRRRRIQMNIPKTPPPFQPPAPRPVIGQWITPPPTSSRATPPILKKRPQFVSPPSQSLLDSMVTPPQPSRRMVPPHAPAVHRGPSTVPWLPAATSAVSVEMDVVESETVINYEIQEPFGGSRSPGIYDTSPMRLDLERSFIEDELKGFKWMDQ